MTVKQPVIFLMGATATGKSALAYELARHIDIEVICTDSTTVYRDLDIGTAKPSLAEQQCCPHHLLDIRDPNESYSAGEFKRDAMRCIADIHERGRVPVLVGGSMLYFHYLKQGYEGLERNDAETLAGIETEAQAVGWPVLWEKVSQHDPAYAANINPNDKQRISRALCVLRQGGSLAHSEQCNTTVHPLDQYQLIEIALTAPNRDALRARIRQRFLKMLDAGFVTETQNAIARYQLTDDHPVLRTVGYRQIHQFLNGVIDETTMVDKACIATSRLAKRQHTWLNKFPDANAFDGLDSQTTATAIELIKNLLAA